MKLAHLILAHNEPRQLERLINRLAHPDADIYIHLDLKTDIGPFEHLKNIPNVIFVNNRVKVYWGSFNIVEATLQGFRQIIAAGKEYTHVNLLSGQDYPLQPAAVIHDYLASNTGIAFMNYLLFDPEWPEALPRIREYHFNNLRMAGRFIVQAVVNKVMPKRKMPRGLTPVGRSQWFTIPSECIAYILKYWDENSRVRRFIKLTWGPDEFIFQTILYNSTHQNKMVNNDLRYIDWSGGGVSPKTLMIEDADAMLKSGKLFARKLDINKSAELLNYIDEHTPSPQL